MNDENLRTSEIEHLIRDIEGRMADLRVRCRFWRQAKEMHPNPALREVELDTLCNLRMFARMLDARLGSRSGKSPDKHTYA